MQRLILVGSPRATGRSTALAEEIFEACLEECPQDGVTVLSTASLDIAPCSGCGACARPCADAKEAGNADSKTPKSDDSQGNKHQDEAGKARKADEGIAVPACVIDDDMGEVVERLDEADELIVVAPVYFAGLPSQMKALVDRLQPYYFTDLRHKTRRPLTVHVVGEGGDPYGYDALLTELASGFGCAGFHIAGVLDWVGCLSEDGEIERDATEVTPPTFDKRS